jgi:ABC-type transport system substrate-binding protein
MATQRDQSVTEQAYELWQEAHDFDRRDPLFGLSKAALRGPRMDRRTVLRLLAASGALTLADVLAACTPTVTAPTAGEAPAAAPAATAGGELTCGWAGTAEITTLDPAQINQVLQFQIASNVLSGLTHINPDLTAEGDLAVDWSVSDDGLTWTFNLREGVTFHNGDPFTADDVVFTFNRSKDPAQSIHSGVLANVLGVEKIDDLSVQFTLENPAASFLVKTLERASGRAMTIVSQGAIESLGLEQYGLTPVGTGPFQVVEHQLGQSLVLERFENYYDPERPMLDRITFIPIPEPEPLAAAIEAGDIQLIGGNAPAPELVDRFLANPDLVVSQITGPGFQALWMNPHREPFQVADFNLSVDELKEQNGFKVRLAIAKAIDREDLIERALFGRATPGFGSINPAMRFFFDTAINEVSEQRFDVAAAQQLLADAGFPNGEGFPTLSMLITPAGRREGEILADILQRNLNITVELDVQDFTVQIEQFNAMDFDLLRIGSGGDYDPDDALVDWMLSTSTFNGPDRDASMAFGYFADAQVDELIQQQRVQTDPEQRKALVQQANQITSDKVAAAFLFHPQDILVYRTTVNYPEVSRIPGLVDLDRVTITAS